MIKLYLMDIKKFRDKELLNEAIKNSSNYRIEKYNTYKNDEAKLQCICATYLIDKYLIENNLREKDMEYEVGECGKLYFKSHKEIHFNISHSKNLTIVAFSDREIGCDIQVVKKIETKIYDRVLSDKEKEILYNIKNERERVDKFFEYWVTKEAIIKRSGIGLKADLKNIYDEYTYIEKKQIIEDNEIYYIGINNGTKDKLEFINI